MKKYIALVGGILVFANTGFAVPSVPTCKGGTIITGSDGTQFCKSNALMSWYAAHAWCYANGRRLATNKKACDKATPSNSCNNMKGSVSYTAWGFVNYRSGSGNNQTCGRINLNDGQNGNTSKLNRAVRNASGEVTDYGGITDMYALCE